MALCCLDGLTLKEAASKLGLTEGVVKGHVERGRARLKVRLAGRRLTLAAGLAVVDATRGCLWAAPTKCLVDSTVKAGAWCSCHWPRKPPLARVSAEVLHLTQSSLNGSVVLKLKVVLVAAVLMGISVLGASGWMLASGALQPEVPQPQFDLAKEPRANETQGQNLFPSFDRRDLQRGDKKLPVTDRAQIGHVGKVWSVAFSPDGKQVVTGSGDSTALLWDTASGKKIRALPRAYQPRSVRCVFT